MLIGQRHTYLFFFWERGPGWWIHGGVEDTIFSTNKQLSLSYIYMLTGQRHTHTQTQTHIHIHTYIRIYIYTYYM